MTTINCECCWITPVALGISNSDHRCPLCRGHQFVIKNLLADHQRITAEFISVQAGKLSSANREVEQIDARLTRVRGERDELAKASGGDLAHASEATLAAIHAEAVLELREEVTRAYKTRNRAMVAVWTIDERHHAGVGEKCSRGTPLHGCKEYNGLDFIRSEYERWEIKQIQLMKEGKDHGLPENHPEARKLNRPSYEWRGMRSTEPERLRR
ncbi:hypothetical protein FB472_2290 [Rhodoglobus vestalii]|uniref:Uncharacterized protein n=1 Tax=Rhodoglobus vestalii TaxID=193384 RepID=A0A8H2PVA1_9MICO|nr:hypothetical protein [Rhodoglobus vestalii]TQO20647.1 hypothetical protein FB472_2290 [Rhodoglobus vestalii]